MREATEAKLTALKARRQELLLALAQHDGAIATLEELLAAEAPKVTPLRMVESEPAAG